MRACAALAGRLLQRGAEVWSERSPDPVPVTADRIAIGVAHRDQAAAVRSAMSSLGVPGLADVVVDTANRLQGREFDVTIVLHPLSGRRDATTFHLEAGRLCVLLSRHRHACIVVARAGIPELLDAHPSVEPVHLNVPVKFPDGWEAQQAVLAHLEKHRVPATPLARGGARVTEAAAYSLVRESPLGSPRRRCGGGSRRWGLPLAALGDEELPAGPYEAALLSGRPVGDQVTAAGPELARPEHRDGAVCQALGLGRGHRHDRHVLRVIAAGPVDELGEYPQERLRAQPAPHDPHDEVRLIHDRRIVVDAVAKVLPGGLRVSPVTGVAPEARIRRLGHSPIISSSW